MRADRDARLRSVGLRLLAFPASSTVLCCAIALIAWPGLLTQLATHWGAGGADGWMPRGWAVGIPVIMNVAATSWCLVAIALGPRSLQRVIDVCVLGGLFGWLGAATLMGSIWLPRVMGEAVILVIGGPVLLAVLVYRSAVTRYIVRSSGG